MCVCLFDYVYQWQKQRHKFQTRTGHKSLEGEYRYSPTLSLTSVLYGSESSASRLGRSTPGKETRYPLYRKLGGPQGPSGRDSIPGRVYEYVYVCMCIYIYIEHEFQVGQVSITCRNCRATSSTRTQNIHDNILHETDVTRTNCNDSKWLEVVHYDAPGTSTELPAHCANTVLRVCL